MPLARWWDPTNGDGKGGFIESTSEKGPGIFPDPGDVPVAVALGGVGGGRRVYSGRRMDMDGTPFWRVRNDSNISSCNRTAAGCKCNIYVLQHIK